MIARLGSRAWVLGGVVVAVVILAAAWLLVISPVRSDASQLREDTASVQVQNVAIQAQNTKLRKQAQDQDQLVAQLEAALDGLPSGPSLPVFSRQLATQATAQGLTLTGVAIGTPISSTPTTGDTTTATTTTTTTTEPTPAAIPITVTTDGPALAQLEFLRDIQQVGPRLALVTSTSLTPSAGSEGTASIDDAATMTLQVTVFTNPLPKQTREQLSTLIGSTQDGGASRASSDDASADTADLG